MKNDKIKPHFAPTRILILCGLILAIGLRAGGTQTTNANDAAAPYLPQLLTFETNIFDHKPVATYRFTGEQLARMASTRLETNRVVVYLEREWPIERLKTYCTKKNAFPKGSQNLVAQKCPVETDLHKGTAHGFDRMWVYVNEDDGQAAYIGKAGSDWHRWTYSLNVKRGKRHWVIIDRLPNDFVDSARYDPK